MDNHEQMQNEEEYDYNREPPLDSVTTSANRSRSKYVFMTLCFLLALLLLYTYLNGSAGDTSTNWFPLVGAIVLAILGVVFLRSPDNPPARKAPESTVPSTVPAITANVEDVQEEKALSPFEELVQEAISTIPAEFREKMDNLLVQASYEPDEEVLNRVGAREGYILLGLYEGVPLTTYGRYHAPYPEVITIYQRNIENYCQHDPARIREQVRTTVLHEVAHHFGMGHEEMPIWVK
jgi:LPXTG-motif cell wall-anchored protein